MENSNEKSLKVINETIFDKIKRFVNKILGRKTEKIENKKVETLIETKTEFENRIKINEEETINLIKRIEKEENYLEEQEGDKLEEINANLTRYLEKIKKEINNEKTEKAIVENQLRTYQEQMRKYKEKMAN